MGVYRFEDLRVWQAAKRQCDRVGILLKRLRPTILFSWTRASQRCVGAGSRHWNPVTAETVAAGPVTDQGPRTDQGRRT